MSFDDIVLPPYEKELLKTILLHAEYKANVYREWGFEGKNRSQGLGITVLFAGQSGTGKTMAAEILSRELKVNTLKVDLSQVISKYMGETEKNLDKIFESAKNFVKDLCLGNNAEVDIDDGQRGGDRYGREIGVVYCNGVNVNSELIEKQYAKIYTDYCDVSEFANDNWAGCSTTNPQFNTEPVTKRSTGDTQIDNSNCDSSYPDVCIPYGPPDLDCPDISQKRFSVSGSDPHGFDADGDGIGCES